jgi:lipopolysaccharide export system permease protein
MTTILSRHVAGRFLQSLGLFLASLVALAVIIDFAVILRRLLDMRLSNPAAFVLEYYLLKVPFLLPFLLPVSILLATAFTLTRLSRGNELVPILMGGCSLRRVCGTFLVAGAGGGLALAALEEYLLPAVAPRMTLIETTVYKTDQSKACHARGPGGNQMFLLTFEWSTLLGKSAQVTLVDDSGQLAREIVSEEARWLPDRKGWLFLRGTIQEFEGGRRRVRRLPDGSEVLDQKPIDERGVFLSTGIEPAHFTTFDYYESYRTLAETRRRMKDFPRVVAHRIQYYSRFAAPLTPVILLLLGIPLMNVLGARHTALVGGALCFLVALAYFSVVLLGQELGGRSLIPAEAAAFGPLSLFAAAGAGGFLWMRT